MKHPRLLMVLVGLTVIAVVSALVSVITYEVDQGSQRAQRRREVSTQIASNCATTQLIYDGQFTSQEITFSTLALELHATPAQLTKALDDGRNALRKKLGVRPTC